MELCCGNTATSFNAYAGVVSVHSLVDGSSDGAWCPPEIVQHRLAPYRFSKRRWAPELLFAGTPVGGRAILITYDDGSAVHDEIQEETEV